MSKSIIFELRVPFSHLQASICKIDFCVDVIEVADGGGGFEKSLYFRTGKVDL